MIASLTGPVGRQRANWALIVLVAIIALTNVALAKTTGTVARRPVWNLQIVKIESTATRALPQATAPKIQGRIVEPLEVEDAAEILQTAVLVQVRVVNLSRTPRILRWNVARSPHLKLPNGRSLEPLGHKLHGLADSSIVVRGVLEVEITPKASYDLYPVFALKPLPRGVKVVIDGVGVARLPLFSRDYR